MDTFSAHEATRKRRRWGCTCGCLVFLVLIIFGVGYGFYRGLKTVPETSVDHWMEPSTNGILLVRANTGDEGVGAVVKANLKRLEEEQKKDLPENEQKALAASFTVVRHFLSGLFIHKDVPTYMAFDAAARNENYLTVIQLKNLMSWLLLKLVFGASETAPAEMRDGAEIRKIEKEGSTSPTIVALTRRYILVGNDRARVDRALAASRSKQPPAQANPRFQQQVDDLDFDTPAEGEDITGLLTNDSGRLAVLLDRLGEKYGLAGLRQNVEQLLAAQKISLADINGVRQNVDILSENTARISLTFLCRTQDVAKKVNDVLLALLAKLRESDKSKAIQRGDIKTQGSAATLTIELTGLKPVLGNLIPTTLFHDKPTTK